MSEAKMIRRNVAVKLAIICVILLALLVGNYIVMNAQITDLQTQVNDLKRITNFQKTESWLSNKTLTIKPNQNVTETFFAPLGGNVGVIGFVDPPNLDYWINVSWVGYYGRLSPDFYEGYSVPYVNTGNSYYFSYEFPVVSFAFPNPNVVLTIGNGSPDTSITVNLTVTFTY